MATSNTVLQRRCDEERVSAELHDDITDDHLKLWRDTWRPFVAAAEAKLRRGKKTRETQPEDLHWEWDKKTEWSRGRLALQRFALTAESELQGLMMLNLTKYSKLPSQVGKHVTYVEFLATAPWNRPDFVAEPRYRGVGLLLMRVAIEVSRSESLKGRVGLHSLPQACAFYRNVCGMTELGADADYHGLVYFEMTESQAVDFCES